MAKEAAFIAARPVQQRIQASGGWPEGAARFTGENPPGGAVLTYYQRTRHLFGHSSSRSSTRAAAWSTSCRPASVAA